MIKKENKIIITVVVILLISLILLVIMNMNKKVNNKEENLLLNKGEENIEIYVKQLEDGTKLNNSKDFNKAKKFEHLEITNIQYTSKDGNSVLLADVTNKGTTIHEEEIVKLTIIGENNEVLTVLEPIIGRIEPGKTIRFNSMVTIDLANAKDFKIERN